MKIGIVTLQLRANIGGVLQAYALQYILQGMGHEVAFVARDKCKALTYAKLLAALPLRLVQRYILADREVDILKEWHRDRDFMIVNQHLRRFIDENINLRHAPCYSCLPKSCFDAIVVGSDQVWRPAYFKPSDIRDAYLKFATSWSVRRVAYAASFGGERWEYSPSQEAACRRLISKFDAVSVRELSAVEMCREHFGVEAEHLLDPTMLLDKQRYVDIVQRTDTQPNAGNMLVYILDDGGEQSSLVEAVAQSRGLTPFRVNSPADDAPRPAYQRIQPSLEQWLRGFMDAEFVVTDSFHACVFAIIFNKPFIAYVNDSRGASRFTSLTGLFGLEGQLLTSLAQYDAGRSYSDIDWARVNEKHRILKQQSLEFLRRNLNR